MYQTPVYIDMDDVLAECAQSLCEIVSKRFNVDVRRENLSQYWIENEVALQRPDLTSQEIRETFFDPGFFLNLNVIPGAQKGIAELVKMGLDLTILTCPPPRIRARGYIAEEKITWLSKHFPYFTDSGKIIISPRKDIFSGGLLIDDSPANLSTFNGRAIVFDAPWNRKIMNLPRANDWDEVPSVCKIVLQKEINASKNSVRFIP